MKFILISGLALTTVLIQLTEARRESRQILARQSRNASSSSSEETRLSTGQCPENEVWSKCPPACYGDSCTSFVYIRQCHQACGPTPGCVCQCGYFRDTSGRCIPKEECGDSFTNTSYEEFCGKKVNELKKTVNFK